MEFITLAVTHFLALLSPGPDFFLIVQSALRMKLRYSIAICAGIAFANGVYLTFALLGLESFKSNQLLLNVLQYCGASYLILIGYMLLKSKRKKDSQSMKENRLFINVESLSKQFSIGFLSGILNPKNMLFYFSLLAVLVSEETPLLTKSLYALWMVSIVFIWDTFIAVFIGNKKIKNTLNRTFFYIEKCTGVALTLCGISLVLF